MNESAKFQQLTEELLAFLGRTLPFWATEVGDRRFDGELGDFSEEGILEALRKAKEWERRLRQEIDPGQLSPDEKLDWELVTSKLEHHRAYLEETRPWRDDPTHYVTYVTDAIYSLMVAPFDSASSRAEKVRERLSQIPKALEAARRNLVNPPQEFVLTAIDMTQGSLEYFEQILRPFPREKKEVLEAWQGFLEFLKNDLLTRAQGNPRLGKEKYDFLLQKMHFLETSSDELLEIGEEAFRKGQEEMAAQAAQVEPGRHWREVLRRVDEPCPTRRELLPFYRNLVAEARHFVTERRLVEVPPEHKLAVDETPRYERPVTAHACYIPIAVLDPSSQGLFFVTPVERSLFFWRTKLALKEHTFSEALRTVIHESFPGHHLQYLHAARHPSKLRRLFSDEFYCEGWAFYCEQMMLEQGFHASPVTWLYEKRNMLRYAMRVVVDVKLHTRQDYAPEEAMALLERHLGYDPVYARREIDRYLLEPTQAASYYLGKQELLRLKADVAKKQGNSFRLADFHNAFLSTGSIPFKFVRKLLH